MNPPLPGDGDVEAQPPGGTATRREALFEMIGLHARVLLWMPLIHAALLGGIALGVGAQLPLPGFIGWAGLSMAIETGRMLYARSLLRRLPDVEPHEAHLELVLLAAASGATLGSFGLLFFPSLPPESQAFIGVVLFVLPAGGIAVSMSSRYIGGAYSVAVLGPATLAWVGAHPAQKVGAATLSALYCGLMVIVAIEGERTLLRTLAIRHERDRVVRDLERRNAEVRAAVQRAENAAQARARVLAAASHDLRQPLHALSIYSAILAAHPAPETLVEAARNIDQIVRSLGSLLGGLLDLSRLSAGNYASDVRSFALDRVLADACAEFDSAALAKGLALDRELPPVHVRGDAMAVTRIVRNLLDNAIKYTDVGTVRLGCAFSGADVWVTVQDSGKGIAAHEHERVFEEFYQIDNPGRDRGKGVGLGLAIVKRLVELIGAKLEIESALGAGTRLTLRLGNAIAHGESDAEGAPAAAAPDLGGRRVFVIDDEHDVLASMRVLLHLWRADVHTAATGAQARALFARFGRPDLLITDLRLGEQEHGAQLTAQLLRDFGACPVLVLTGETEALAIEQSRTLNLPVLQKPVAPESLLAAIDAALLEPGAPATTASATQN